MTGRHGPDLSEETYVVIILILMTLLGAAMGYGGGEY